MNEINIEKIVSTLVRQKELGHSTIIFLGAGASASSGIPLASEIVEYINQHFPDTKERSGKNYFQTIAGIHPAERKRVFKHFTENAKVNETHLIAAVLIYLGYVDVIVTTNFDPLLQRTSSILRLEVTKIDVANNVNVQGHNISTPTIYYLHGELSNVWQYNTLDELEKKETNIQNLLSHLSVNRSWIIVGYSGNDPIFEKISSFEKFDNGLFWIGYKNEMPEKHVQNLLDDKTKNAYYLKGYNSDSFFKRLIDELDIQNSVLTAYLGSSLIQIDDQIKLHKNRAIQLPESIKPLRITKDCRTWVKEFGRNSQGINFYYVEKSFSDKIKYWFLRLLNIDSELYIMKSKYIKGEYDTLLVITEKLIEKDSSNSLAYFFRGLTYGKKAQKTEDLKQRSSLYAGSIQDFKTAKEWMTRSESRPIEYEEIDRILTNFWAKEHNDAVDYLTNDSIRASVEDPERYAISHLNNAITIQPDSAITYIVLASTLYNKGDVPASIETYEMAMEKMDKPEIEDYDFLIGLYIIQERFDDAEVLTLEALKNYHENAIFLKYLADIYIEKSHLEEAIAIIEYLIAYEPDNPKYYLVIGTQVYQRVVAIDDRISQLCNEIFKKHQEALKLSDKERDLAMSEVEDFRKQVLEQQEESTKLTQITIDNMEEAIRLNPDDDGGFNILGIVYQNKAANYFDHRNSIIDDMQKVQELDGMAREALETARYYFEQAAGIDPNVGEYWESLLQVYNKLGMEEEAKKLKEAGKIS